MLCVISTDIKKSSSLWKKNFNNMFKALQWHNAILRACFDKFGFKICDSSPEGDAFIASKNSKDDNIAIECIENIIYLMNYARSKTFLDVGSGKGYENKIHIRIGLACGKKKTDLVKYKAQGVTKAGKVCSKPQMHAVCSNNIVFKSEQAEITCKGWEKHYNYSGKGTTEVKLQEGKVKWTDVKKFYFMPSTIKRTGMVLFIHNKCKSTKGYCGKTSTIVDISNNLVKTGWIAVKVKRDKTAMLLNLSITKAKDAKKEFDKIANKTVDYCAAFGEFNVVLNKDFANNYCFTPDAFGDTVNAAARMHNALAFIKKPEGIKVTEKSRSSLNLGSGKVFIYKPQKIKL